MKALLKTTAMAIALTTIAAGSAAACDTLDDNAQALTLYEAQDTTMQITLFGCAKEDAVAEELKGRLDMNDSVSSKILGSATKSVDSTTKS